ncbi:hypothetical protein, partial [Streptococcus suis]
MTQTHHTVPHNHNESEEATLQPDTHALMTGAQLFVTALLDEVVEYTFRSLGVSLLPLYDTFYNKQTLSLTPLSRFLLT